MSEDKWVSVILKALRELQLQIGILFDDAKSASINMHGELAEALLEFQKKPIDYSEITKPDFVGDYIGQLVSAKMLLVEVINNGVPKKNFAISNSFRKIVTSVDKCLSLLFDLRNRRDNISNDFNSDYLQTQIKNLTVDVEDLRRQLSSLGNVEENVDKKLEITRNEVLSIKSDLLRAYDSFKSHSDENFNFEITRLKNQQYNEVKDLIDKLDDEAKFRMEDNQSEINKTYADLRGKFEKLLAKSELDADDLKKMVGALSGEAMAASHLQSSIDEKTLADNYRLASLWTVGLMVVTVVVYTFFFADLNNAMVFAAKLSIALLFLVPAGYLARESAKHRDVSEYRRHIGINLLAMRAYMSDMEPKERAEFKMAMADKLFTNYKYSESGKTLDSFSDIAAVAVQKK